MARSQSRQALLRDLTFEPVLPAYSQNACTRFERPTDQSRNDEVFSASLMRLFAALMPRDEIEGAAPLRLTLTATHSPTDSG